MQLQAAISSGKPFKRPMHTDWHTIQTVDDGISNFGSGAILANDWEIKTKDAFTKDEVKQILIYHCKFIRSYIDAYCADSAMAKTLHFADNL